MRKTGPNQAVLDVRAMAAERFPLVLRTKPVFRSLETRVARVRDWADLASRGTDQSLLRAAEAHNLAALILSDCGLPSLARDLCRQQAEIFLTARPLDAAMAKLALQPLINLGRLLTREAADAVVRHALDSTDAYAARDVLDHQTCQAHAGTEASRKLTEMVHASRLVRPSGHRCTVQQESLLDSLISYAQVAAKTLFTSIARPTQHR